MDVLLCALYVRKRKGNISLQGIFILNVCKYLGDILEKLVKAHTLNVFPPAISIES